ncbi:hypothetical protein BH23CHL8_BH23CHL8_18160 [soil metagenome]
MHATVPTPERPTASTELTVWLGLLIALLALVSTGTPPRESVLALIVVAAALAASLRWRMGAAAVIVLLVVGIMLRLLPSGGFSDVLVVTEAAIREMLAGGNPYGQGFDASVPPGAPFAYGPVALAWYLPMLDGPGRMELLVSLGTLVVLAVRGRLLGLAMFAVSPALLVAAGDGSNDTSAGLLILVALLVAVRAPVAGGVLLAVAVAFKPYALAWLPALVAYAGAVNPLLAFALGSVVTWGPALVAWGPEALLWSFRRADEVHAVPYYSLAYGLANPPGVPQAGWQALRIGAGVLVAVAGLLWVRSARSFVVLGAIVFLATLYLGWWSTFVYLAALAPVVCWHLDDWLDLGHQRVVWPGDPVARLAGWVDARWPIRRDWRTDPAIPDRVILQPSGRPR